MGAARYDRGPDLAYKIQPDITCQRSHDRAESQGHLDDSASCSVIGWHGTRWSAVILASGGPAAFLEYRHPRRSRFGGDRTRPVAQYLPHGNCSCVAAKAGHRTKYKVARVGCCYTETDQHHIAVCDRTHAAPWPQYGRFIGGDHDAIGGICRMCDGGII